jgi:hypothetical protein
MMNNVDDAQPVTRPGRSAVKPAVISQIIEGTGPASEALKRAKESLAGPFLGITTDGSLRSDLFPIAGTGVSTQPIIDAAEDLLRTLSPSERETASFEISDDYAWRSWHNMHFFAMRHGLLLHTLDDAKRDKVYGLMRATLSAPGFANARDIMRLNHHAGELTGRLEEFDELYYWISLFGRPSASEPWGWQIDGHHLSINCFILGDQIVLTPDFRGSEPTVAKSGKFAGTRVFAEEEAKGLALMQSFDLGQRRAATISDAPPREIIAIAQADNLAIGTEGLAFDRLSKDQQDWLVELVALHTGRLRPGHAEVRLNEVKRHLDETIFAWMGSCEDDSAFYYRVLNPVILIEFDHIPGIIFDNREPSRRHIHSIVRTPNGNDYGRSLLLDHYRRHDHSHAGSRHARGLE